jgi:hypothetical protein
MKGIKGTNMYKVIEDLEWAIFKWEEEDTEGNLNYEDLFSFDNNRLVKKLSPYLPDNFIWTDDVSRWTCEVTKDKCITLKYEKFFITCAFGFDYYGVDGRLRFLNL